VVAALAVVLASRLVWRNNGTRLTPVATGALALATVMAGAAALYARFIRPDASAVEAAVAAADAQGRQEVGVVAYNQTMAWLDWYLGPVVLALGVVGLIAMVWKGLQTQGPRSSLLFAAVVAATTIVYVHDPNISADQVWAMRRFLPLTLPGLLVAAAWVLAALVRRYRGPRWFPTTAWVAGALVFVTPAALVTRPLRDTRVEVPMLQGVDAVCDTAGPNAAILVAGPGNNVVTLPDSLRAFCSVPTGGDLDISASDVLRLENEWALEGRELVVVSSSPDPYPGLIARQMLHVFGAPLRHPDYALTGPPSRTEPDRRLQLSPDRPVYDLRVLRSFGDQAS
jgi:hypothetical protein